MEIPESIQNQIRSEWRAAVNGGKTQCVKRWAEVLDVSAQTVYRLLKVGRSRKKGDHRIDGIRDAAAIVACIKKRPPKDAGEISTDQAIEIALGNGCIPEEMKDVSTATFNRVIRECGLTQRAKRVQRYQAEYPNQLHHVDASSSQFFYVARELKDDFVLKLHAGSGLGYKNKPVPIRLRPWLYGLTDDYSGYHLARYIAAHGESLADNLQFLAWAWGANEDKPFFGLPERIKADQGPLMKGDASRELLTRLSIGLDGSIPGEKDAHGKIERPWRTLWGRFEKVFFVESGWKGFEITLSELNRRFRLYQEEYNDRSHRYEKDVSRVDAWRRINLRGGAVAMPENAIATAARRYERIVGDDGCLSLDGVIFEVRGLHAAKVRVYEGIFEDKLVVEDIRTGEKYETSKFAPTPLDKFVGHKETPHQAAVKEAQKLELRNTLYMDKESSAAERKITRLPTRIKETRKIENPLDADSFSTLDAAMREFVRICPVRMEPENREAIACLIRESGFSRSYVRELALEIQAESFRSISG